MPSYLVWKCTSNKNKWRKLILIISNKIKILILRCVRHDFECPEIQSIIPSSSVNRDMSSHTEYRIILLSVQRASLILPTRTGSRATRKSIPPQSRRLRVNWNGWTRRPSHVTLRYELFGCLRETNQGQGRPFRTEKQSVSAEIIYERSDAPVLLVSPCITYRLPGVPKIRIVSLTSPQDSEEWNAGVSWIYDGVCGRWEKKKVRATAEFRANNNDDCEWI